MKGDKYLHKLDSLQERNRFLGIALIVLVGINVLNLAMLMRVQSKTQTIVVPIGGEGMQIGAGKADARYIRRMARYITNQIGAYSAGSARSQYEELLQLFSPAKVTEAGAYFDKVVSAIERYPSISSNVLWSGSDPLKFTSKMIQVTAIKERIVNGSVSERNQVHYCIAYHIDDARFYIDSLDERGEAQTDPCFLDDSNKKANDDQSSK